MITISTCLSILSWICCFLLLHRQMICLDCLQTNICQKFEEMKIHISTIFFMKKKLLLHKKRRRIKHQCTFSIRLFHQYFINFIHHTQLATVDTRFSCVKFRKEMKYIKLFTIFFMKKTQLLLSKQAKKTKTHMYIFSLLFQYFINFIPPTLLATVQTKCSGKQ